MRETSRGRGRRAAASIAMVLLLTTVAMAPARGGQAEPPRWELTVDAPADANCIDAATASRRVEARAGSSSASRTRIVVQVRRAGLGWSASVTTLDGRGEPAGSRELHTDASDCSALDAGLVLVIAAVVGIAMDPPERVEEPAKPPSPPPRTVVPVQSADAKELAPAIVASPSEPAESWRFGVGVGARALSGLIPGGAIGLSAGVTATLHAFQLHASAIWLPNAGLRIGARGESHFTVALGELDLCGIAARPLRGTLAFCAGGQAGVIRGQARGLWIQNTSQQPVLQAVPSARALLPLTAALSVQSAVGAAIPLVFPTYSYVDRAGRSRRYHTVEAGLWAEIGVGLRFGS